MEPSQSFQGQDLTLKQRKWLKHYIETGNASQAARMAGYQCQKEENFRYIGYQNLTKLHMETLMEDMGLTNVYLINNLILGLSKSSEYSTKFKYLELALQLKGRI